MIGIPQNRVGGPVSPAHVNIVLEFFLGWCWYRFDIVLVLVWQVFDIVLAWFWFVFWHHACKDVLREITRIHDVENQSCDIQEVIVGLGFALLSRRIRHMSFAKGHTPMRPRGRSPYCESATRL